MNIHLCKKVKLEFAFIRIFCVVLYILASFIVKSSALSLTGSETDTEGYILINGGLICSENWDEKDALVACTELG